MRGWGLYERHMEILCSLSDQIKNHFSFNKLLFADDHNLSIFKLIKTMVCVFCHMNLPMNCVILGKKINVMTTLILLWISCLRCH